MVMGSIQQETEVVVVGGGPGGYVAAIRAADLGHEVLLIDERERLGGVCLLEGCIPSKTLIAAVEVLEGARRAQAMGITFEGLKLDVAALRQFTEGVVSQLSGGIQTLLKKRGIAVLRGYAELVGPQELRLSGSEVASVRFKHCILATGSRPALPPQLEGAAVWTSREALALPRVPERLLVVGGGYIGLELGFVYAGLGSRVTLVELLPQLLAGADADLVEPVRKSAIKHFAALQLETRMVGLERRGELCIVETEGAAGRTKLEVDEVLVSVGRKPNTEGLGLERVGIALDARGLVPVDAQQRTRVPHIYAIGDIVAGPGLAHKASREGKVAAEVIAGRPAAFDNVAIPAVVFTDPELAWAGLTEAEARQRGLAVTVGKFPLSALGRARTVGRTEGLVKVIADAEGGAVRGVGIVGPHASELIAEAALALEMGAVLEDLTATIHPHPTFSEALMEAAEVAEGLPVHIPPLKRPSAPH
ncbi:MAG: dihydrolipoyl dehydrogenase [Proteobacteria bacterium]|nr:dihydrolipoyl dehydrogenase [Pseudomonadota bacterium]